ncbi:Uncharacterised protein [Mycobacteroides abscessus subsp. abscessus]|nr:Uncharacterised protein [Mycobacteroides abscessus subsp. abscessus]
MSALTKKYVPNSMPGTSLVTCDRRGSRVSHAMTKLTPKMGTTSRETGSSARFHAILASPWVADTAVAAISACSSENPTKRSPKYAHSAGPTFSSPSISSCRGDIPFSVSGRSVVRDTARLYPFVRPQASRTSRAAGSGE